jgi:hypothetical protein
MRHHAGGAPDQRCRWAEGFNRGCAAPRRQNRATRQRSQPRSPSSCRRLLTSAAEVLLPTLPNARLQLRHKKRGCAALACVPRPRAGSQNRVRRACGRPTPPSSSRAGESRRVRDCCKRSCVAPAAARRSACSTGRETPPPRPIPAGVAVTYARRAAGRPSALVRRAGPRSGIPTRASNSATSNVAAPHWVQQKRYTDRVPAVLREGSTHVR